MSVTNWLPLFLIIYNTAACNFTIDEDDNMYIEKGIHFSGITPSNNVKEKYHYSLIPDSTVISIGLNGGLFFKRGSDRERLCQVAELRSTCKCRESLCRIPLGIWRQKRLPSRQEPPERWHVMVCVRDKNDNCPNLPKTIQRTISENVKPGSKIPLPSAEDIDSVQFSKTFYKLTCDNDSKMFKLVPPSNNSGFPQLEVVSPVDNEVSSTHSCQLDACENSCCNSASVTVSVTDENDHTPLWTVSSWLVSVKENTVPNSEIIQLSATDADSTYNQLTFSIIEGTRQDLFLIESKTGKIRLAGYLDYDTMPSKELYLTVKVHDNDLYDPKSVTGTVTIGIEDVNDNRPMISLENNVISIDENVESAYLGFMTVSDADSGLNKVVSCFVTEPSEKITLKAAKMESSNQIFDIFSTVSFDHEIDSSVTVKITCHDMGHPKQSSEVLITLRISDLDDNDVRFVKKVFVAGIEEEKEIGSFIMRLEAVDRDTSSIIEYVLKNKNHSSIVELDIHQGVLRTATTFDRETLDEYRVPVVVREKLAPNKTDEAEVILKILDINDHEPKFEKLYSFSVSEGKDVNYEVGRVFAVDNDLRNNGTVIYSQQHNRDNNQVLFFVDHNGKIKLFQRLDYELQTLHHLVILATDQGVPVAKTATTTVIISVIDENDNPPVFKQKYFEAQINCHTRFLGRDLYPTCDNDTDPKNQRMEYQIATVDPQIMTKYVRIDNQSGEISFDIDQNPVFKCSDIARLIKVKIVVYDPTNPQLKDHCILRIVLTIPVTGVKEPKVPYFKDTGKDNENLNSEDYGSKKNQFEYNLLIVIIFIVLSLMLVLLLTCVAVFARRCKQEEMDLNRKADNEFPSPVPSNTVDLTSRSAINKSNNIPKTEFQMSSRLQPDDDMAVNSALLWDSSNQMIQQYNVIRDDRNDYQMLGHTYTTNLFKNFTYSNQYPDNYFMKPADSQPNHKSMLSSTEKNCAFFSTKPIVSTSFV